WDGLEDGRPQTWVGTGTLFRVRDRSFLVTAAHNVEGDQPERRIVFSDGSTTELHGVLARIDRVDGRKADVAVALLLPEVASELERRGRQFLSEHNLPSRHDVVGPARLFAGFPATEFNPRKPLPKVFNLAERAAPDGLVE